MIKPLIIGENNPYHTDLYFDLYPAPERSAGYRLAMRIMGLQRWTYLELFDRRNLLHQLKWDAKSAHEIAMQIIRREQWDGGGRILILLGAKVAHAFRVDYHPRPRWDPYGRFVVLPHPSGRNAFWNRPTAAEEVRRVLRVALPDVPFGETDDVENVG